MKVTREMILKKLDELNDTVGTEFRANCVPHYGGWALVNGVEEFASSNTDHRMGNREFYSYLTGLINGYLIIENKNKVKFDKYCKMRFFRELSKSVKK